ncbi:MAG: hypothetical protein WCJ18_04565, partial [Planctomycetota bacterium]
MKLPPQLAAAISGLGATVQPETLRRLEAALAAVDLAGHETLRWFNAPTLAVEEKADLSPVTQAD